jgi:hypothetical protein
VVAGVTAGEAELAGTGAEPEGVTVEDAEVAGLVWAVGLSVVPDGVTVGTGVREAGVGVVAGDVVVAGVTPTVAAGDGLTSR